MTIYNNMKLENVTKEFTVNDSIISNLFGTTKSLKAVRDVSLTIEDGKTIGLVGESGSGKSTVANLIMNLYEPTSGAIRYKGDKISEMDSSELKSYRRDVQMVFQDPYTSVDPRYRVGSTIAEPLKIHTSLSKSERKEKVMQLLETVNLSRDHYERYPHELSGGQIQRVSIATALSVDPEYLILDEPTSALDVSVQANIINLLMKLQSKQDLTYLTISHDLGIIKHISDFVAVMYLGEIVEFGSSSSIFKRPAHPYTQGLIDSIPSPDVNNTSKNAKIEGEIPSPHDPPSGCSFHTRCKFSTEVCEDIDPGDEQVKDDHTVACHHWDKVVDRK